MSVIVTDSGFAADSVAGQPVALGELSAAQAPAILDLSPDDAVAAIARHFDRLALIRVAFDKFSDGRGFTLARALRRAGYTGRLRAVGHVLADQYAMARRSGFDEVEIDDDLAARQPEAQWLARADWQAHDHQSRLRG